MGSRKKSIALVMTILVSIFTMVGCSPITFNNDLFGKDSVGIGKTIYLEIISEGTKDYTIIESVGLWDEDERNKLVRYMKDNNLRIVPGKYVINQGTSFEGALKKFQFEIIQ